MLNASGMCKLKFNEISMPPVLKDNPEIVSEFLRQDLPVGGQGRSSLASPGRWWKRGSALFTPSLGLMASG